MKDKPSLIVSHDAGGAFLLSKWCLSVSKYFNFEFYLSGPAIKIFSDLFLNIRVLSNPDFSKYSRVISSTGWQTDFEIKSIISAKNSNIYSVSYLDHWVNYLERFTVDGSVHYPDEIWCGDSESLKLAEVVFNGNVKKYRRINNRHILDIKSKYYSFKCNKKSVLICLEPIRNGYSLASAYKYLSSYLKYHYSKNQSIIIRDHPSSTQTSVKLLYQLLQPYFKVTMSCESLEKDLSQAIAVFGYQSSVLVYALKLNIPAFSYYPSSIMEPILPHKDITYISTLSGQKVDV